MSTSAETLPAAKRTTGNSRGPLPSTPAKAIYRQALDVLRHEGADALTVRRLAAELHISTCTLYKRVRSRDEMVRGALMLHMNGLTLGPWNGGTWQSASLNWCLGLHKALTEHPSLTRLMQEHDVSAPNSAVDALTERLIAEGFSQSLALRCARTLAEVTIGMNASSVSCLHNAINWVLAGIDAERSNPKSRLA